MHDVCKRLVINPDEEVLGTRCEETGQVIDAEHVENAMSYVHECLTYKPSAVAWGCEQTLPGAWLHPDAGGTPDFYALSDKGQLVVLDEKNGYITADADLQMLVDETLKKFGRIDILVNNAGMLGGGGPFLGGDPALLDAFYRTNLRAPYVLAQLAGGKMAEQGGGVIFNISSGLARMPGPNGQGGRRGGPGVVYGTSKAALDRFAAGVAAELREKNIAITNIYPGFTLTERLARMMKDADTSRMERPETTAKAVAFLSRDPMPHTGRIVVARELADEHGL